LPGMHIYPWTDLEMDELLGTGPTFRCECSTGPGGLFRTGRELRSHGLVCPLRDAGFAQPERPLKAPRRDSAGDDDPAASSQSLQYPLKVLVTQAGLAATESVAGRMPASSLGFVATESVAGRRPASSPSLGARADSCNWVPPGNMVPRKDTEMQ